MVTFPENVSVWHYNLKRGLWSEDCVQVPALAYTSHVILVKLFQLPGPQFLHLSNGIIAIFK
jgi:hypothetical protein